MKMKITKFDRKNANALHDAIIAAITDVTAEFGVSVRKAGGSIDEAKTKLAFEFEITDPVAAADVELRDFRLFCGLYDLSVGHYKARFTTRGSTFELIGFMTRRPKFPFKCRDVATGKVMLYPDYVRGLLKPVEKAA
jgi:hypothetical protein